MATLKAMFKLFDGYSSTITKIMEKTDKAAKTILGASKENDKYNTSLKATETAATSASNGLRRFISMVGGLAAAKKVMDLTDTYTSTNARLSMITGSLEEQKALQKDIFDAANRARGQYDAMANAAAKLKMLAGDNFGSNQEAIAFAELLTKSLKVSGAGQGEQNSAFLQLTQAMTAGKLQGDEFRSIMENAPMVADAIATYMGKSKSELKELSSQGLITSDIIKGAMFAAADDINGKFSQMPMTFADIWNMMSNNAISAFGPTLEKLNNILNSGGAREMLTAFNEGLLMISGGANQLIDAFVRGDPLIRTALSVAAIMAGLWAGKMFLAAGATMAANWPLLLIVAGVGLLITSLNAAGVTFSDIFGFLGALLGGFYAAGYDVVSGLWNMFISFAEFLANVFNDPLAAVVNLFVNMGNSVLNILLGIAQAIDGVFGSNLAGIVETAKNGLQAWGDSFKSESYVSLDHMRMDAQDYAKTADTWETVGSNFGDFLDTWDFSNPFTATADTSGFDYSQFATAGNPAVIKGTGKGGAVKVENEEDLEWMRRLAERDYVARIAQNTLAPSIHVEFTGPIANEADTDSVMAHVAEQLKEIIASAPEGVPA